MARVRAHRKKISISFVLFFFFFDSSKFQARTGGYTFFLPLAFFDPPRPYLLHLFSDGRSPRVNHCRGWFLLPAIFIEWNPPPTRRALQSRGPFLSCFMLFFFGRFLYFYLFRTSFFYLPNVFSLRSMADCVFFFGAARASDMPLVFIVIPRALVVIRFFFTAIWNCAGRVFSSSFFSIQPNVYDV